MNGHDSESASMLAPGNPLQIASHGHLQHALQRNPARQAELGQYFTSEHTALFMASLFSDTQSPVNLLDAGAGSGILTAAFVINICRKAVRPATIYATAVEKDESLLPLLNDTLNRCGEWCRNYDVDFRFEIIKDDFILYAAEQVAAGDLFRQPVRYSHAILNPPYGKINSQSKHRQALRTVKIETVNLYTAFLALAVKFLQTDGELVAITPRSFCNGPYYRPFRRLLLGSMALRHIHVFNSRSSVFREDEVLQENIIYHAVKHGERRQVRITASDANYSVAQMTAPGTEEQAFTWVGGGTTEDVRTRFYPDDTAERVVDYNQVVDASDPEQFIQIAANEADQILVDRMNSLPCTLEDLALSVSTGRVVDFRAEPYLRSHPTADTAPLIYPGHLQRGGINWPQPGSKKPNAIVACYDTRALLLPAGMYVLVKRFTAKEEKRRVVAAVYDPRQLLAAEVGFENHLNVFHVENAGLPATTAYGLALYLNSSLVDAYFRLFSGHTQVNAADLHSLKYPSSEQLERLGRGVHSLDLAQEQIDHLLAKEVFAMTDDQINDPFQAEKKITEAVNIIQALGLPRAQQNDRSALTLLALLDLKPDMMWSQAANPMIGITPIMDYMRDHYGVQYAPNTRETIRRQTMHQFVEAGFAVLNPDEPERPVNSPFSCYQVSDSALQLVRQYGSQDWASALENYLVEVGTLKERYANRRSMARIPVNISDGTTLQLTPGQHNELIKAIIEKFGAIYAPGGTVLYVGDTGDKFAYFDRTAFSELGIVLDEHGKMPDVVIYYSAKDWLLLIEAVTSHGPVDGKRRDELRRLFANARSGVIYVTAFLSKKELKKYVSEIAWATEVWVAEAEEHIIHFDGERFLGPYEN